MKYIADLLLYVYYNILYILYCNSYKGYNAEILIKMMVHLSSIGE